MPEGGVPRTTAATPPSDRRAPRCPAALLQDPSWPVVMTLFDSVSSPDFAPIYNGETNIVSGSE